MITSTPKNASSTSSGTTISSERSRSSSSEETTKPTAPPPSRSGVVSPPTGSRAAVGDVHEAEHAEAERRPADHLATGRPVADRVAHDPPADQHHHQRHQPADLADRAGDDGADELHDAAGHPNQTAAAITMASPKRNSPAPSRRCSGSRSRALCPMPRAAEPDAVGDAEPDRGESAEQRLEEPRDRTGAVAHGTRCRPPLRGRPRLLLFFFVLRVRVLEPPRPPDFDLDEDVLLLRDPGGEDVRVAMVTTLGRCHTSHTHHRERVGSLHPTWTRRLRGHKVRRG